MSEMVDTIRSYENDLSVLQIVSFVYVYIYIYHITFFFLFYLLFITVLLFYSFEFLLVLFVVCTYFCLLLEGLMED